MQLLLPHHYAAFDNPKPHWDDPVTVAERADVRNALLKLHDTIWPFIQNSGWDLHTHRHPVHYVSSHHFVYLPDRKPIVEYIDGMWLHYGKSPEQLDFMKKLGGYDHNRRDDDEYYNAFYLHTRIQFYLNAKVFRCWLLLATDKNYYDRSEFLRKLDKSAAERAAFHQLLVPLFDKGYFYEIDGNRLPLNTGLTSEKLMKFVRLDVQGVYSGIVKEYLPSDPSIAENRIGNEMIQNLQLLYPVYDFMAWRPGKPR